MEMRRDKIAERIPFTKAHAQSVARRMAEQDVLREKTKAELLRNEGLGAAIAAKDAPMEGTITKFKKLFSDAITYGYQRDVTANTGDADIRSAVREQSFINTVAGATADSHFATPIESEDPQYAKGMRKVRTELAKKLASGNVASLSNNELDVLLSIIFSSSSLDGNPSAPQAYGAFFDFLENAAQHSAPGEEGTFIANVLLSLASRNTMDEEFKLGTMRNIADVALIDRTLGQKADPMLERAVALFKSALDRELVTPSTTLNPELEVPGMGYCYVPGIGAVMAERMEAVNALAGAKTTYDRAMSACTADASEANVNAANAAKTAFEAATRRKERADSALIALVPGISGKGFQEVLPGLQMLVSHEQDVERISRKFADAFRFTFIDCRRNGKGLDEKGEKDEATGLDRLGDNGHPLVMTLVAQAKDVSAFIAEHDQKKAAGKIAALEAAVDAAELPGEITDEMKTAVAQMKEPHGTGATDKEFYSIEKRYGYPIKKAAICAMKSYASVCTGTIRDEEWITARVRFQGEASPRSMPLKRDKFRNIKNDLQRIMHRQLPDAWYLKYPVYAMGFIVPYYPVKWFVKATFNNDNLGRGIREQTSTYIDKGGQKQQSGWKRKYTGWLQVGGAVLLATDLIGAMISSATYSAKHSYGFLDGVKNFGKGAAAWYYRMPPKQLSVTPGTVLRSPLRWWTPLLGDKDTLKTYEDDMNIPSRLPSRADSYYTSAFGVREASAGTSDRLNWLRKHPGVLQFFQERTSGVHVNDWRLLPKDSRTTLKLDTTTVDAGKVKAARVWKVLKMDTTRIADGLVLNKANADAFVDALRAMEGRGENGRNPLGKKDLDYAFMQRKKLDWETAGFLVSKEMLSTMESLRIKSINNALFVRLQPGASGMLEPRAKLGVSTEYVENPDALVSLWRQNVTKLSGEDPTQVAVSQQVLQTAFESARTALWGSAIRSDSTEFQEARIMRQVGTLQLSDSTTAMLSANTDVRKLLLEFGGTSGYNLNPARIDDFVQRLVDYKKKGGKVDDFSPFMQGVRVGWARGQGYFGTVQFTTEQTQSAAETDTMKMSPQHGALSADAQAFYASAGATQLKVVLTEMHANEGAKQRVYDFLTNTSPRAEAAKRLGKLSVTGQGAGMSVTISDNALAKKWLATYAKR